MRALLPCATLPPPVPLLPLLLLAPSLLQGVALPAPLALGCSPEAADLKLLPPALAVSAPLALGRSTGAVALKLLPALALPAPLMLGRSPELSPPSQLLPPPCQLLPPPSQLLPAPERPPLPLLRSLPALPPFDPGPKSLLLPGRLAAPTASSPKAGAGGRLDLGWIRAAHLIARTVGSSTPCTEKAKTISANRRTHAKARSATASGSARGRGMRPYTCSRPASCHSDMLRVRFGLTPHCGAWAPGWGMGGRVGKCG
jgi:hypothetical protein